MTRSPAEKDSDAIHNELLTAICPTLSRIVAIPVLHRICSLFDFVHVSPRADTTVAQLNFCFSDINALAARCLAGKMLFPSMRHLRSRFAEFTPWIPGIEAQPLPRGQR
jgi:hypothetical protein